ncbi:MAG: hypothetical protein HYR71_09120 [Chloroflexi bacterium]|nr:hypothetical protein [Chloroflexota bacterium]
MSNSELHAAKARDIRSRAWSAILAYAIFRWESAGTIALTILLAYFVPQPFAWWRWWYWLLIGVAAEALIIVTSVGDVNTGARVVSDLFRQEFDPSSIASPKYRAEVERALEYRRRTEELIRQSEAGVLQQHLQESTSGVSDWIAQIFRLAQRLDVYERDDLIKQDAASTPGELRTLTARVQREPDEGVREQARQALASKQAQWQNLEKLQQTMEKAELQLDATLTALGTVYSQLVLIRSKDDIADSRAQRLRADIAEQVAQLNDLQKAMDEVYTKT